MVVISKVYLKMVLEMAKECGNVPLEIVINTKVNT
jgi:hypothetical protein